MEGTAELDLMEGERAAVDKEVETVGVEGTLGVEEVQEVAVEEAEMEVAEKGVAERVEVGKEEVKVAEEVEEVEEGIQ